MKIVFNWKGYRNLQDDELKIIWLCLQSLEALATTQSEQIK
jgi:hypothetical protein